MPPDIAQLSLWQAERALASLSEGEKIAADEQVGSQGGRSPEEKER